MMKQRQKSSYASKVSKLNSQILEEDLGDASECAEQLLQSHSESIEDTPGGDVGLVTVDEVPHAPVPHVQQPQQQVGGMGEGGRHPMMMQSPGPGPGYINFVSPPNIYSQGSPPLPLAGPLQLVYLQPTAEGVRIVPFQATGYPTFSPCSPLGFPAHPHHPVVVQSPQSYLPPTEFQVNYENGMPPVPNMYPYPNPNTQLHPPPQVYHYNTPPQLQRSISESVQKGRGRPHAPVSSSTYRTHKLFRPWEDEVGPNEGVEDNVPIVEPESRCFEEDDFPSLQSGLSKMNIK